MRSKWKKHFEFVHELIKNRVIDRYDSVYEFFYYSHASSSAFTPPIL